MTTLRCEGISIVCVWHTECSGKYLLLSRHGRRCPRHGSDKVFDCVWSYDVIELLCCLVLSVCGVKHTESMRCMCCFMLDC